VGFYKFDVERLYWKRERGAEGEAFVQVEFAAMMNGTLEIMEKGVLE
jgi:hypothetical protein